MVSRHAKIPEVEDGVTADKEGRKEASKGRRKRLQLPYPALRFLFPSQTLTSVWMPWPWLWLRFRSLPRILAHCSLPRRLSALSLFLPPLWRLCKSSITFRLIGLQTPHPIQGGRASNPLRLRLRLRWGKL